MTFDRRNYPRNWEQLRAQVRERSKDRCEAHFPDGARCNAPNGAHIHRLLADPERWYLCAAEGPDCTTRDVYELFPEASREDPIRVVLTCAHLCQDTTCGRLDHLRHYCQLHHLRYDAAQHAERAAATRQERKAQALAAIGHRRFEGVPW